jgi:thioesterase domain-containing protein
MVPSTFVVLDALPLTANGKIDRQRLPAPERPGVSAGYIAPTTPEETLLCELVTKLLGVPRVGLADQFFHLGGDSLIANRLAAQVRARLGRELAVQTVFESPVLGDLATRIGLVTDSAAAFDTLLPIRTTGSEPPLFCLHPGTGLCWAYSNLLQVTSSEQPLYGIQTRSFNGNGSIARTLDEIVADSLATIRRVRPHGPYRLLGWSFGGVLAHMLASRLQADGECVERLVLLDSYPPPADLEVVGTNGHVSDRTWRELARGTDLAVPPEGTGPDLDADAIVRLARAQSHIFGAFSLQQIERVAVVMSNNTRLFSTARFERFDGDIDLFVATRQTPDLEHVVTTPDAWAPFCTGSIRVVRVDAEHHRMVSPAALRQIRLLPVRSAARDLAALQTGTTASTGV